MPRPRKETTIPGTTPVALLVSLLIGAGTFYCAEVTYGAIKDSGAAGLPPFPAWRAQMGSACVGILGFMLCLFLLESLGKGSRRIALRSIVPWAPLVVLTGAATLIHVPAFVIVITTLVYSPWACLKTCAVR
jgi:hypothetical protein